MPNTNLQFVFIHFYNIANVDFAAGTSSGYHSVLRHGQDSSPKMLTCTNNGVNVYTDTLFQWPTGCSQVKQRDRKSKWYNIVLSIRNEQQQSLRIGYNILIGIDVESDRSELRHINKWR